MLWSMSQWARLTVSIQFENPHEQLYERVPRLNNMQIQSKCKTDCRTSRPQRICLLTTRPERDESHEKFEPDTRDQTSTKEFRFDLHEQRISSRDPDRIAAVRPLDWTRYELETATGHNSIA